MAHLAAVVNITITVPIVTVDEMQAIWDAQPNSTLSLYNGRKLLDTRPMLLSHMPRTAGDQVTSKDVLFPIVVPRATVGKWSAELFGRWYMDGGLPIPLNVIRGDSIRCWLTVQG